MTGSTEFDFYAYDRKRAALFNSLEGKLEDYDCPLCRNRGYFMQYSDTGYCTMKPCRCMEVRDALRAMRNTGVPEEAIQGLSFEAWQTPHRWQEATLASAKEYVAAAKQGGFSDWFIMSGNPGCGKTMLCSTVFLEIVKSGVKGRYVSWREFSREAKSVANDRGEFRKIVDEAKQTPLLYLDDFWKGRITPADVNLAFEVLNNRYQRSCLTILSSEHTIDAILRGDEAIGSRLRERARDFYMDLSHAENWRLK